MPSEHDFNRMQEEAARRAREMQARARYPIPRRTSPPSNPAPQATPPPRESPAEPIAAEPAPVQPSAAPSETTLSKENSSLLDSLFKDKERTIILALLILLGNEGDNHELMFALMFLLL